ncbi:MAG: circadian clock protein KaiC [Chitinophagaceae bacterium]
MKLKPLAKTKTGINGLDEITGGGLPTGRPTLICGGPGCGKTLFSIEFIVNGAMQFNEPGVFMTFEEKTEELVSNVASLGFDLEKLQKDKKVRLDYVYIQRGEIEETGEFDLDGLFIRLDHAITTIGAKRVVLDTIENLFGGLENQGILRAELRRLFTWLKDRGVTAIITAEKGEGSLTRHGLEEYVSDCVILLDHRIMDQVSTRRLRVVKYRGSSHGTNEYPFLIDESGISVLPVTSLRLEREVSSQRIPTGIRGLDEMLGNKGFFRGSSILISGTSGTGKTSIAAFFTEAACKRKERCLFFAFEESPQQIVRNMGSIGLDLKQFIAKGLLQFHSAHPTEHGLEQHLVSMYKVVKNFRPKIVIIDPITNLIRVGNVRDVSTMLMRLIDMLHTEGVTVLFTALSINNSSNDQADEAISSLVDAWIQVRDVELNAERNRGLFIMKSRGMSHSKQVREFLITDKGIDLVDVYRGTGGILLGSAREAQKLLDNIIGETQSSSKGQKIHTFKQHGRTGKKTSKKTR